MSFRVVSICCPYCLQWNEIRVERDLRGQFVQDCEVCCRPWSLRVSWSGDEPQVQVEKAQ